MADADEGATAPLTLHDDAVLLLMDVQQGFEQLDHWGRRNNPDADKNISALAAAWQDAGRPIVRIGHDSSRPGSPLAVGTPGNEFKDYVAAVEPTLDLRKKVNSAFLGTPDLNAWLTDRGARQIVIAGIQTNACVETTARMGGNLGFEVVVAIDATYTFDVTGPNGETVSAEELYRITGVNLHALGFARVADTADVLAAEAG